VYSLCVNVYYCHRVSTQLQLNDNNDDDGNNNNNNNINNNNVLNVPHRRMFYKSRF
jgi:hypothetical protein